MQRFTLVPVPPFRLDLTAWALRRRASNQIDRWDGETYRRTLLVAGAPAEVEVRQRGGARVPRLDVSLSGVGRSKRRAVTGALERLLGLQVDLGGFYRFAARDRRLRALVQRFRGVKPPRFPTLFETLANAIACQQVTLSLGIVLLNRLAQSCRPAAPATRGAPACPFPRPQDLLALEEPGMRHLGFSRQKIRALRELAAAACEGRLDENAYAMLGDHAALERLSVLRGVGRWSAEYALLRGLGRLHVFPGDDVGARKHLGRWLGLEQPLDYAGVARALERWRCYRGLVYFHLLLTRLADEGAIAA
ncbi:MAG: DNA-3-methyladenine glycosylase 2 family protein [Burkholderiales bacterium]|nr:DNA-3-methyladenine glycosylase 2 family protein [Burkholderiales bacterium]